jgi:hypothetical protein
MVPPCARTKIMCANEKRVHDVLPRARGVLRCARDPSVRGSGGPVRDCSGYRVAPNPLQKTRAHSTCTSPPDQHTEGHRAHRRTCALTGVPCEPSDIFCAPMFSCAHMGVPCAAPPPRKGRMGAHDVHPPPHVHPQTTCAESAPYSNGRPSPRISRQIPDPGILKTFEGGRTELPPRPDPP